MKALSAWAALLAAVFALDAQAAQYTYCDDFSTLKIVDDAYQHDPVVVSPDTLLPDPRLVIAPFPSIVWFGAFPPRDASVYYRFPLRQTTSDITAAEISFTIHKGFSRYIPPIEPHFLFMTATNGRDWVSRLDFIDFAGDSMTVRLSMPQIHSPTVYVCLHAREYGIDDLCVTLTADQFVGTERVAWGSLKSLYK